MSQQSWTIGSDSSCDIVVKNSTISGQHCRLVSDSGELTLTDLDSTNGTFVNGQRLNGSTTISTTDRITLGQTLCMPWPESLEQADIAPQDNQSGSSRSLKAPQVISLGRGSDNSVVLNGSNVSTYHARLIVDGDHIVLEDLGSTNGTSVGKVENKVNRANVKASDTVFLGSTGYEVSDLIAQAQPAYVKVADGRTGKKHSPKSFVNNPVVTASIGGGAVLMVLLAWFALRDRTLNDQPHAAVVNPSAAPVNELTRNVPDKSSTPAKALEATEPTLAPAEKLAQSLFVIVCTDPERKTPFRVGTGFAIDSEHVATSAAVIQAIHGLKENGFPDVILYSPATSDELTIESTKIHPQYDIANTAARKAQQKHDAIFDDLESKPPKPDAFQAVKEQLLAARMEALEAIDRKTSYDVAVIKINQSLSHWLPSVDSNVSMRPNQKLNVTGYAFDVEDPYFDRAAPIDMSTMPSRVGQLIRSAGDSADRISGKGLPEQREYAYLGSPAMNSQGQVVAIYSRPTPAEDNAESETSATFDATLFQRVRECLAEPR